MGRNFLYLNYFEMKRIYILFFSTLVVNGAFSQGVKWGIKSGGNLSSLSEVKEGNSFNITHTDGNGKFLGFHAGVFANISFGNYFGFQPELLYSLQGGKHKQDIGIPCCIWQHLVYKYSYVQLPLLVELKPIANLGILAGPQFGLNVSRSMTFTFFDDYWDWLIATYPDTWQKKTATKSGSDYDDYWQCYKMKKIETVMVLGLQYTIKRVSVGARYNIGCVDNYVFNAWGPIRKGLKSSVIQASLGFVF